MDSQWIGSRGELFRRTVIGEQEDQAVRRTSGLMHVTQKCCDRIFGRHRDVEYPLQAETAGLIQNTGKVCSATHVYKQQDCQR